MYSFVQVLPPNMASGCAEGILYSSGDEWVNGEGAGAVLTGVTISNAAVFPLSARV